MTLFGSCTAIALIQNTSPYAQTVLPLSELSPNTHSTTQNIAMVLRIVAGLCGAGYGCYYFCGKEIVEFADWQRD